MNGGEMHPEAVKPKTRTEIFAGTALIAVFEATRAMEAETSAMKELEEAYRKANDASAELKNAIAANRTAKIRIEESRKTLRQVQIEAKKVEQIEARADEDEERKKLRLKDEETKASGNDKNNRSRNKVSIDDLKREADEAEQKARIAHRDAERARAELWKAEREIENADREVKLTSTRIQTAKELQATAKEEVARAEIKAQRTIKVAQAALKNQSRAKQTLDHSIKKLKALMADDAKNTQVIESSGPTETGEIQTTPEEKVTNLRTTAVETGPGTDVYKGIVKLVIANPVDHAMVKIFQQRLQEVKDFRIQAIYGSAAEGIAITVLAEQPVPLVGRLNEMGLVDRVSRISRKEIEIALKPAQ